MVTIRNTWAVVAWFVALALAAEPGPVETYPPEARGQAPAFPGQTRVNAAPSTERYKVVSVATGLESPWGLAFLPDGRALVTEKPGRLRVLNSNGSLSVPLPGVPKVLASGQAGLLDIVLDPQFAANHRVYLTYHEDRAFGSGISVYRATFDETSGPALLDGRVIFRAEPSRVGTTNVGSRMAFLGDGTLIVSVGDRFGSRDEAQNLGSDLGKLIRITVDGQIPPDNPFVGVAGARGEIWSLGHRNPQGLTFDAATGTLWEVEHGARGGDELNRPVAGRNYGWPVITYGIDYSGFPIGKGLTRQEGLEQPVYYWDPVIAPSGLALYQADLFPSWKGNLFVGGLRGEHLDRLVVQEGRVVGEERLLTELGERVREVEVGPEGAIYLLTDNPRGRVLKLVPAGK